MAGLFIRLAAAGAIFGCGTAFAQAPTTAPTPAPMPMPMVNEAVGVPVFPNDILDRPYKVLGEIKTSVRKATLFSNEASQKKIYGELWERGRKMGADAVIKAQYGNSHVSLMSWGATTATGTAIKFTEPAADAAAPPAAAK